MSGMPEQAVVKVDVMDGDGEPPPRVEVIHDGLCSLTDLRRAVVAGAVASGIMCALAGAGLGYWLGLQDRRR